MDGLRMNNHPTPTTPDEAKLRPVWSTLPLQGRVRRLSAIADIAICNRPAPPGETTSAKRRAPRWRENGACSEQDRSRASSAARSLAHKGRAVRGKQLRSQQALRRLEFVAVTECWDS